VVTTNTIDGGRDPVIEIQGVSKTHQRGTTVVRALRGVDLAVPAGSFVAVVGPSGAGKSSLLNAIAGLDVVDDGRITVAGEVVTAMDQDERALLRRRCIGIVFQFFNLLDDRSALQNVALAALIAGVTRRQAERRAMEALDLLGLTTHAATLARDLAGGQRQRVAIARALVNDPTVVLADEPTGALDADGRTEILALLRELPRSGRSVLLVTHDDTVAGAADEIVSLRDGQVVDRRAAAPMAALGATP
jgi:putative ABC transport system ATP-binding protein